MISFIDEKGKRHGALAEIKRKKAVNGEKSIEGIIYNNKKVIDNIDIGWKILFEGEKYVITYALPVDNGNTVEIQFDAVHEFFYDFLKSSIYETLNGSNTMIAYLNFIFKDSGYSYLLDNQVPAIEKENFGMASRISLFNNLIKSTGAEFLVNGRVVRIMYKVGRDLSTVVRKGLNLQELKIEKNIKDFITYRKGFGAFIDPDDESLGRLEVEYESPLATIYGRLEGEPIVDERYSVQQNLYDVLEKSVENSYDISVHLTMEDLTKAGYEYEQPQEGDYIMVINEDIGFKRKVRIISYESEFDSTGKLIDHQVTCNSVGLIQSKNDSKFDNIYKEIEKIEKSIDFVYIAANGKNMIYKGPTEPTGEDLVVNDMWYKPVGNGEYEMRIWTGAYWEKIVVEDARFKNLDASNITTGSIRGPNFELDLVNDFILMGKSYPDDYKLYFDKNTFSMKLSSGKTIEKEINNKADQNTVDEIEEDLSGFESIVNANEQELVSIVEDLNNYRELISQNEISTEQALSEIKNLVDVRIPAITIELGEFIQEWKFLSTRIVVGEEGISIGTLEGSTAINVSKDRIDFIDGSGESVAYITGQVMRINRGIFVDSAQIGEHKIETITDGHTIFTWV